MMLQPIIPLPVLVPAAVMVVVAVLWLSIVASRGLGRVWRIICCFLNSLAALVGLALLFNPGHIEQRPSPNAPVWLVAADVSQSMSAPVTDDSQAEPRSAVAARVVRQLAEFQGRDVRWVALADSAVHCTSAEDLANYPAQGNGSAVMASLATSIETLHRSGKTVAGAVLVTDGRDTRPRALRQLMARAGAAGCPVHTVPLGSTWQAADIAVGAPHPFIQAYPGVQAHLTATVRATRMGERQVQVELLQADGVLLQQQTLNLKDGEPIAADFSLSAQAGEYLVRVAVQPGESRADNNTTRIVVREVNSRIRVFLAEGAPYWDSKFLAQYLREQAVFDVRSVHRLSEKRFYHINSGDDDAEPTETPDIPTTAEALRGYDIVVLGKGMEHLLDAAAARALTAWVREQGGILVLARGRCHAGQLDMLSELEPFVWSTEQPLTIHRFQPAPDGGSCGLFGRLLPEEKHPVWNELPELEDVSAVTELRPQTRVLAVAAGTNIPILGIMPCGLGAVACINGEGLWKWDFYPEARNHGNMYREFWRQFLPWVQTAAEFMPGYDLSLHVNRANIREGEGFTCLLGWRGLGQPSDVKVRAINLSDGKVVAEQKTLPVPSTSLPRRECTFAALPPGEYLLRAEVQGGAAPECRLSVRPLPQEHDNLDADAEMPARIAEVTGGMVLPPHLSNELLNRIFAIPPGVSVTEDVYCPLWAGWQVLAFMIGCLGTVWFIRRRKGLA